jgi:hypothetical protein
MLHSDSLSGNEILYDEKEAIIALQSDSASSNAMLVDDNEVFVAHQGGSATSSVGPYPNMSLCTDHRLTKLRRSIKLKLGQIHRKNQTIQSQTCIIRDLNNVIQEKEVEINRWQRNVELFQCKIRLDAL